MADFGHVFLLNGGKVGAEPPTAPPPDAATAYALGESFVQFCVFVYAQVSIHPNVYDVYFDFTNPISLFSDKVISHNPPLSGLPVHDLLFLNHDRTDHNTKTNRALVNSNCYVNQLLFYDVTLCRRIIQLIHWYGDDLILLCFHTYTW